MKDVIDKIVNDVRRYTKKTDRISDTVLDLLLAEAENSHTMYGQLSEFNYLISLYERTRKKELDNDIHVTIKIEPGSAVLFELFEQFDGNILDSLTFVFSNDRISPSPREARSCSHDGSEEFDKLISVLDPFNRNIKTITLINKGETK